MTTGRLSEDVGSSNAGFGRSLITVLYHAYAMFTMVFGVGLFPSEDAESYGVNNYKPDCDETELRADID